MAAPLGNQNGAKGRRWQDALNKALARFTDPEKRIEAGGALDAIAEKVVRLAIDGDWDSIIEIGNRLDGKPAQAIIGGSEDDPPLRIARVERVVVRANPPASDG